MEALEAQDPRTVGTYRVLGRIGEGGMGRVYLARNAGGRSVALKFIHADMAAQPGFRERFRREADVVRRVGAPGTVPVVDTGLEERHPWYASEYVSGPSLQDSVDRFGPLPAESLWRLAADLAQTLEHVHRDRLVHRDLKPSNVLLSADGPRLIDFGIVHAALDAGLTSAALTSTGARIGTPAYMSPEQAYGEKVTAATDVYSFGLTLAFAATGVQPHRGSLDPQLPGVAEELRNVIRHCLDPEPERRPDAGQLVVRARTHDVTSDTWLPAQVASLIARTSGQLLNLEARADTELQGQGQAQQAHQVPQQGQEPGFGPGHTAYDGGAGPGFHGAATQPAGASSGPSTPPPPSPPPGPSNGFHGAATQAAPPPPYAYGGGPGTPPPAGAWGAGAWGARSGPAAGAGNGNGGGGLLGRPTLGLMWLVPAGLGSLLVLMADATLMGFTRVTGAACLIGLAFSLARRGGPRQGFMLYWLGLSGLVLHSWWGVGSYTLTGLEVQHLREQGWQPSGYQHLVDAVSGPFEIVLALGSLSLIYIVPAAFLRFRK
ncbi:serine/threonine-protein kinase [Streptomyces endophyticus]|uniref:Serine/threonine protein kinase n=1 Tax=Streptomyces endophyticus TaxID=714166 RepID=A0ABU6FEZ6_9ACTN|nr:serine/threonine-protein kinase [Streptomyces endophyticus]MEB8342621.1 serine/threonine protein kinase [Streptomyces endophyticus]